MNMLVSLTVVIISQCIYIYNIVHLIYFLLINHTSIKLKKNKRQLSPLSWKNQNGF